MSSARSIKYKNTPRGKFNFKGFTQVELMISLVIMSIFFLAITAGFGPLVKGIFYNKSRTLGTNLAQEKIEKLKANSYYRVLVTATPLVYADPAVYYDNTYYPPEEMIAGGIVFTRLTYVQVAQEDAGDITLLPPTASDTGMKLITIVVTWQAESGSNYIEMKNIISNPDVVATDAIFSGIITDVAGGAPVSGAVVKIAENTGWLETTGTDGTYDLNVFAGTYNITVTAHGYFSQSESKSIGSGQTVTHNFSLTGKNAGTVIGTVWINQHVLISQVVGSSECVSTGFEQEYVELFNPTTAAFVVASGGVPVMDLIYQAEGDVFSRVLDLDYYVETIPPFSYYLIANTITVSVVGSTVAADAVFSSADPEFPDIIKNPDAGGFGIAPAGTTAWIDRFGWDRNNGSKQAEIYETEGLDENIGLEVDEQYLRICSTFTPTVINGVGNCYDSNNNNVDFVRQKPMAFRPHNTSDTGVIVSGTPLANAAVTLNDGLSPGVYTSLSGNPPIASFSVPSVATGTWVAVISGSGYLTEISTVQVVSDGDIVAIPNATTDPSWNIDGYPMVFLNSAAEQGYISGQVLDANLNVITNPLITISDGYNSVSTDSNGNYLLQTSTGDYTVTANPNLGNLLYVSHALTGVTVTLGSITSGIDFVLSQGGSIQGFVTRDGTNPLPAVLVIATDAFGNVRGEEVSGANGTFTIINLSTGSYNIYPVLDSGETYAANPTGLTIISNPGDTVFSSTFTISGAFGRFAGTVTDGGENIETGVLIVITEDTLAGSPPKPPALSSATLTGNALYAGASGETGTFSVEVRGSTSTAYNVYAFYPNVEGTSVKNKYYLMSSQYVIAGGSTTINFTTWLP